MNSRGTRHRVAQGTRWVLLPTDKTAPLWWTGRIMATCRFLRFLVTAVLVLAVAGCSVEVPVPGNDSVGVLGLSHQRAAVPANP